MVLIIEESEKGKEKKQDIQSPTSKLKFVYHTQIKIETIPEVEQEGEGDSIIHIGPVKEENPKEAANSPSYLSIPYAQHVGTLMAISPLGPKSPRRFSSPSPEIKSYRDLKIQIAKLKMIQAGHCIPTEESVSPMDEAGALSVDSPVVLNFPAVKHVKASELLYPTRKSKGPSPSPKLSLLGKKSVLIQTDPTPPMKVKDLEKQFRALDRFLEEKSKSKKVGKLTSDQFQILHRKIIAILFYFLEILEISK